MTPFELPADQQALMPTQLLETARTLGGQLHLSQLRGERPDWKGWLRAAAPEESITFMSVLSALVNPPPADSVPVWNRQAPGTPVEDSELFVTAMGRLIAGHHDWTHYRDPATMKLIRFTRTLNMRIGVLTALTLHERHLGVSPGQSAGAQAAGTTEIKIGSSVLEFLLLNRLSAESLNHLTDLAWALDRNVARNLKLRQYLYRQLPEMRPDLELRPPRSRHLPLTGQPKGVRSALLELRHPALGSEPSWTPPTLTVTRQTLGVWPRTQGQGQDYARRLGAAWQTMMREAPQDASRAGMDAFWNETWLRDRHLTGLLQLSLVRMSGVPMIILGADDLTRAAHVLTELTDAAQTEGLQAADHSALKKNSLGRPQLAWSERLSAPPSAWSLAAGLACGLYGHQPSPRPEWLHALMLADQALTGLATQAGADTPESLFGLNSLEWTARMMINALSSQLTTDSEPTSEPRP